MKNSKSLWIALFVSAALLLGAAGCVNQEQYDDLMSRNRIQQDRIAELENGLNQCEATVAMQKNQLQGISGQTNANISAKDSMIKALEDDINKKKAMIEKLQQQLLEGGTVLPPMLTSQLEDFASKNEMVTFDSSTGSLKFKSDLLFNLGSDQVQANAADSLKTLAGILKAGEGQQFDLVIVGHTDDVPIKRAETKQKHPTNWHLSVHRAISVLNVLSSNGLSSDKMAVKGYGEYRPLEQNKEGHKGNPVNRRVEIFLVPSSS